VAVRTASPLGGGRSAWRIGREGWWSRAERLIELCNILDKIEANEGNRTTTEREINN